MWLTNEYLETNFLVSVQLQFVLNWIMITFTTDSNRIVYMAHSTKWISFSKSFRLFRFACCYFHSIFPFQKKQKKTKLLQKQMKKNKARKKHKIVKRINGPSFSFNFFWSFYLFSLKMRKRKEIDAYKF